MLLVVVDRGQAEYGIVERSLLRALEHFGMGYRLLDLAEGPLSSEDGCDACCLVMAQEGLGASLPQEAAGVVRGWVEEDGLGLVSFDHRLSAYAPPLRVLLSGTAGDLSYAQTQGVRIADSAHFITRTYEDGEERALFAPVELACLPSPRRDEVGLVSDTKGRPALRVSRAGRGRIVQFLVSPRMWDEAHLGHFQGLDGLLWRSIVWAARKPFAMLMFPGFVAFRVDDANGSANMFGKRVDSANRGFAYLHTLHEHGYVPNVGLFAHDITDDDARIIKAMYDTGAAQFSPHALTDPNNINEHPIYMRHDGREFSLQELQARFARADALFERWGIKQAATLNAHFGEVGHNAVPLLTQRGVRFTMNPGVPLGCTWEEASQGKSAPWAPWPYGDHGFNYDVLPDHPELFNAVAHPVGRHKLHELGMGTSDLLWWKTTFWDESPFNDVEGAASKGADILKLGLDGGFFGCLVTHEQRIATLSAAEWRDVLDGIERLTGKHEKVFASYDHIAQYAQCKRDTRVTGAHAEGERVRLKLVGKSTLPLRVQVFADETGQYQARELGPFEGEAEVVVG